MAKGERQKVKLLALLEILKQKSDEAYPLTIAQLIEQLSHYGVSAERKSLYDDMETLRAFGYDVISVKSKSTGYYLGERQFSLPELKLLAGAVESSRFITKKKSEELIRKLSEDAGEYGARNIKRQVHISNRVKSMNESIYYHVDDIHAAIAANVRIRFRYFYLNEKKEKVYRRDGEIHEVSPFALIWADENYYLVAYDAFYGALRHYRVDKMQGLTVTDLPREGQEHYEKGDLSDYSQSVFGMFGGEKKPLTLRVENRLAGVMLDRFGMETLLSPDGDDHFLLRVRIAVSPNFFGWVFGFGDGVEILSPDDVREAFATHGKKALAFYQK
ncbi:MAG: transcriptional regulator [Clostridia bacterium]|nr:transcriptional regulator [Clostridia bacterium]